MNKEKVDKVEQKEEICNYCGYSCNVYLHNDPSYQSFLENYIENGGLINAKAIGGYHSTPGNGYGALDDMSKYQFSLCEFCLDDMFSNFAIPPKINQVNFDLDEIFGDEEFVPAIERINNDAYSDKKYEEHFIRESKKRKAGRERRKKLSAIR